MAITYFYIVFGLSTVSMLLNLVVEKSEMRLMRIREQKAEEDFARQMACMMIE